MNHTYKQKQFCGKKYWQVYISHRIRRCRLTKRCGKWCQATWWKAMNRDTLRWWRIRANMPSSWKVCLTTISVNKNPAKQCPLEDSSITLIMASQLTEKGGRNWGTNWYAFWNITSYQLIFVLKHWGFCGRLLMKMVTRMCSLYFVEKGWI